MSRDDRRIYDSATLLKKIGLQPIEFIAKEGLSLINGTGASTAIAALAIYDCQYLATASQVLSAFGKSLSLFDQFHLVCFKGHISH